MYSSHVVCTSADFNASSSSSSSSQDRPIGPLPAKCWPEAFHSTFIHNIRERGTTERNYYQYHHNCLPPLASQLLQMKRWGEESKEEEPQKTQIHSHSCSFRYGPLILGGITNRNFMRHYQSHAGP